MSGAVSMIFKHAVSEAGGAQECDISCPHQGPPTRTDAEQRERGEEKQCSYYILQVGSSGRVLHQFHRWDPWRSISCVLFQECQQLLEKRRTQDLKTQHPEGHVSEPEYYSLPFIVLFLLLFCCFVWVLILSIRAQLG